MRPVLHLSVAGVILAVFSCQTADATEGVFAGDGQKIYLIGEEDPTSLQLLDVATKRLSLLPTRPPSGPVAFIDLSWTEDGRLLALSASELWSLEPAAGEWRKLCGAPPGAEFVHVASNPKSGETLLIVNENESRSLRVLAEGSSELETVRVRRHLNAYWAHPLFDARGGLLIVGRGDIWHGKIEENETIQDEEYQRSLLAYRYAPLASLETGNHTPAQMGVDEIVAAEPYLYAHVSRMGGSGYAALLRINAPPKADMGPDFDTRFLIKDRLQVYRDVLRSAEIIHDGYASRLCSSPDGRRVYFRDGSKHFLIESGKFGPLRVTQP